MYKKVWEGAKTMLGGKYIVENACIRKKQTVLNDYLRTKPYLRRRILTPVLSSLPSE